MKPRGAAIVTALWWALMGAATAHAQATAAHGPATSVENERLFRATAQLYQIDPDLLAAIAQVESGGNPDAISPKGAQGLMQLMPGTASRFGVLDPMDPVSNTLGAARFITYLRQWRMTHGAGANLSLPEVIAAYNAGEGAVDKYSGIPPYPETQQYVRKVLLTYLFGDDPHSHLATRLRVSAPAPAVKRSAAKQSVAKQHDPIEKLTEIQRLRAVAMTQQPTSSGNGDHDGSR